MKNVLIVGGGISGIYLAYKYSKLYPSYKITLLEKSDYLGGRVLSFKKNEVSFEIGAGRFARHHKKLMKLIKELKLNDKIIPINNEKSFIDVDKPIKKPSNFKELLEEINNKIKDRKDYDTKPIKDLITKNEQKIYDELVKHSEYYSELEHYSAEYYYYVNQEQFNKSDFFVLGGGLSQLIQQLEKLINNKVNIKLNSTVQQIKYNNKKQFEVKIKKNNKSNENNEINYQNFDKVFLAIDLKGLNKIKFPSINFDQLNELLAIEPLYRIYAKYPIDKTTGKVWFHDIGKVITNSPIKYIIPINSSNGTIMISYTDGLYAKELYEKGNKTKINSIIEEELIKLFPLVNINKAEWYKHYYWDVGAHYWKGLSKKEINKITNQILKPFPVLDMYLVGEAYSKQQAWIEGSLESVDMCLKKQK
jgi:protoporphyrinogen oxidase